MSATKHCGSCGRTLAPAALSGLCPKCLAVLAFTPEAVSEPGGASSVVPGGSLRSKLRYFGDYELLQEIARGGMGVVFKARQVSLNRTVAVKMLLSGQFAKKEFVERFHAEARAAANLQHPNIVAIHEVGEHEGQQYFSMDYVEGGHLGELVRDGPLPARRAAAYLKTIAKAIHYAHERGVLHRDLKPSNILIDPFDEPRVTDFGLAKQLQGDSDLTLTGQMIGTPRYMPPEQALGRRGDTTVASDIYSLGAILYHLLTGRPPFEADSTEGVLQQVLHNEPVPPRLLNSGVPRDLETICLKCLSKESRRRYDSAKALAEDLQRWLNDETIHARPVTTTEKLWRWCRRKPALAALVVALHLVGAAGLFGILWQWRRAEQNADAASNQKIRAEQHAARETAQRLRAEDAVTMLELQRVEDLLAKDDVVMGVAYLARIVRQQPTNRIAAQRLLSALTQRNFSLPVGRPLQHAKSVNYAEFSPEGRRVVMAAQDLTARIWDTGTGEPLTPPMIHRSAVRFAHFSPDGGRLVTFTDDFRAHLWEAATGRALGRPMPHLKRIHSAQFSPDGRRVLTASESGSARIWDARTGDPALDRMIHQGPVRWARFSPDGLLVVTASDDKTAQLWDAATGLPVLKPLLHSAGVNGAEFSPDGKRVVTACTDSSTYFSTRVWDVTSGQPMTKPLPHVRPIDTAKFSPDGERIVVALHNGTTRIFNARDWAPLTGPMQHRSWTPSVEFGPEAQRVLTGSHDHTARLWDADSGEPLTAPMQHDGMIWSARLSPDGLLAITASADGTARLWDVRLGAARGAPMSRHARVRAAEFSPDSEWVVTAQDNTARIWNVGTGQQRGPELKHAHRVMAVAFSSDGERVATASLDRTARIWDVRTGQPLTEPLRHDATQDFVSFSPDGRCLATASKVSHIVRLWDARTGEPRGEPITLQSNVNFICFSPDGQRLLSSGNREDVAQIHDVTTGRLLAETPAREGRAVHGEFSPDGQRVLTASMDGTVRIWNAQTLQPLTAPMRHKDAVAHVRFSRDGRWVVTASEDTTAQVWDAHTCQPVGEPLRHRKDVNMAGFSPDGALVVTASDDGTMRLWDARTGRPVSEPFEHGGMVHTARFSPDGRRVLTESESGACVWDVPPTVAAGIRPGVEPGVPPGGASAGSSRTLPTSGTRPGGEMPSSTAGGTPAANGIFLADLAEALIGKRVTEQGALESVSPGGIDGVRQRVSALPRDADFTRWLEWFFADRSTRTISPYASITIPEYVARQMEANTLATAREAVLLAPTNAPALAHLAEMLLVSPGSNSPVTMSEAQFLRHRAETLTGTRTPRPHEP